MKTRRVFWRLQPKMTAGLIVMAIVLIISTTLTMSLLYRNHMEEQYSDIAFNQASIAAQFIDGDSISRYYQTGEKDDYYQEVYNQLLIMKENMGLKYFYVVVPEEEKMVYIWDVGEEEGVCDLLDSDAYYGDGKTNMHNAFLGLEERSILITRNDVYGYLASAYVPIKDSNGNPVALASVDISMDKINSDIQSFVQLSLFVSTGVLAISIFIYYFYIYKIVIKPATKLHNSTLQLITNGMDELDKFKIDIHTGDEFEELAKSFEHMTKSLDQQIKNLASITADRERIVTELNIAKHIQSSMLPCIFPAFPERKEFDIYATMNPAKEVGGDFYDFFMVDERHLAIVMADVSGKGVPAALFMVIGKTLIKDHTRPNVDLGDVFTEVNDLLCESNSEGLFITAFEGVLDLQTGEFRYVNAGHEVPFICKKGDVYKAHKIKAGFVLAGMEGMRYKAGNMILEPGDKLFQYTDGVTEATNEKQEFYGMNRLEVILNKNKDSSPNELLPLIKEDIDKFVKDAEQFDDITMLCLEYKRKMEA